MPRSPAPQVLVFDASRDRTEAVCSLLRDRKLSAERLDLGSDAPREKSRPSVAAFVLDPADAGRYAEQISRVLPNLSSEQVPTVIWGGEALRLPQDGLVEQLDANARPEEIVGRLAALSHLAPMMRDLNRELNQQQRLGLQLNRYFEEIDKEMRMAGRLQQHFLPRSFPATDRLRFASLFRPATWVSGDIFDVFSIDESTLGMFIADAMGHGTAAGLMTMFLRKALTPKQVSGAFYAVTPPSQTMLGLHNAVLEQELPNSQFVTAAYATIDLHTLEVCLSRAGHPYPLVIDKQGGIRELRSEGGLLGLPDIAPEFDEVRERLKPGDKVVFYTDGVEDLFIEERDRVSGVTRFTPLLHAAAPLDASGFVDHMAGKLDHREGSLNPEDDITIVVAQVN